MYWSRGALYPDKSFNKSVKDMFTLHINLVDRHLKERGEEKKRGENGLLLTSTPPRHEAAASFLVADYDRPR